MKRLLCLIFLGCLFWYGSTSAAWTQVQINEWVSSNVGNLDDEDGDTPDWLELCNTGPVAVDLLGYGLSNDAGDPYKWVLPAVTLGPQEYLLIFASGKDRTAYFNEKLTVLREGQPFHYFEGTQEPPANWREVGFDDSSWPVGNSGFGFGDGDDNTLVTADSVFIRQEFDVTQAMLDEIITLFLHVDYDDGYVAYINGAEVARANMGAPGNFPPYDQFASGSHEAELYQGQKISGRTLDKWEQLLQVGPNVLAIQVHNTSAQSSDLTLIPFLSIARSVDNPRPDHPQLSFPASGALHTNYKLSASGETITLTDAQGNQVDQVDTGRQYVDISSGRPLGGGTSIVHFTEPTPGKANFTESRPAFAAKVVASQLGGLYTTAPSVSLSTTTPGATIHYSFDGSDPTTAHPLYTGPITIPEEITVLRASAFAPQHWPSIPMTETYLINRTNTLPVWSIVSDPYNLWDWNYGIYVKGPNAIGFPPFFGANFWSDWERPAHVEFFETDGSRILSMDIGIKIHGGWSRSFRQKSLRLLARGGYSEGTIDYPFFGDEGAPDFKRLMLRNSGTDWGSTHVRDGVTHRLIESQDLDTMNFRPSVILLNGEYWGIQNIRDRQDENYLASYHGVNPDEVDLLEHDHVVVEGSSDHYEAMEEFIANNPISNPDNYDYLKTQMDVDNYATYVIHQVFVTNTDWPQNNIKFWRPQSPDGRWRWLLYDTDFGLGDANNPTFNALNRLVGSGWSRYLFTNIWQSNEFKVMFCNRYNDLLNTIYRPQVTLPIMYETIHLMRAEIPNHQERWNFWMDNWNDDIEEMAEYLQERPQHARDNLAEFVGISSYYNLTLDVDPPGSGRVQLTAIDIDENWTGIYFQGIPVSLTAMANPGWEFDEWSQTGFGNTQQIWIDPNGNFDITARFKQGGGLPVINEINYNSDGGFDPGDWVEIYNNSDQPLDLSDWIFKDGNDQNVYVVPTGTVIPGRDYLVLAADLSAFQSLFPNVNMVLGDLGFGFSGGGEELRLFTPEGTLFDSVPYDDQSPWPTGPDGNGPTLELYQADLDNTDALNWRESAGNGTPGSKNSVTP